MTRIAFDARFMLHALAIKVISINRPHISTSQMKGIDCKRNDSRASVVRRNSERDAVIEVRATNVRRIVLELEKNPPTVEPP